MSEDFRQRWPAATARDCALRHLEHLLNQSGRTLAFYNLPQPQGEDVLNLPREVQDELSYDTIAEEEKFQANYVRLNEGQKAFVDAVIDAINQNEGPSRKFFLDGPAGTGKTFCYETIMSYVRKSGKIAIAMASSGIAASIRSKSLT